MPSTRRLDTTVLAAPRAFVGRARAKTGATMRRVAALALGSRETNAFFRAVALTTALALGSAAVAPPLFAQTPAELAKARTLYKQGLSLEAAGDWGGALAKFEEVGRVKLTPQVRFHIGRCKENLGRLTEALGDYRLAEYEAQQQNAKELGEITKSREALEARIPKVVITRGAGAESATIELDGVEMGQAQIGKEVSVDPGPHRIVAKLRGGQEFEQTVEVAEGETKNVELVAPDDLQKSPEVLPDEGGEVTPPPDEVKFEKTGPGALPWIIGGVGIVGLGAAGYFAMKRSDTDEELKQFCNPQGVCPESKRSLQDDGEQYALMTNIALGVGIVGIGVATVLFITGSGGSAESPDPVSKRKERKGFQNVRVDVSTGPVTGVNLVGQF